MTTPRYKYVMFYSDDLGEVQCKLIRGREQAVCLVLKYAGIVHDQDGEVIWDFTGLNNEKGPGITREEIMAMEPGQELDRLIAKKFMIDTYREAEIKYFSTDITAAWEVAEKMRGIGMFLDIYIGENYYSVGGYSKKYQDEIERVEFNTAPEAICKAALLTTVYTENDKEI